MQNNEINIFAVTDCHQEARKLCCLFSGIMEKAPQNGKNTLICDCGDLFKGIYDRNLCVDSYITLRKQLPEAKIVLAVGNNDFGFNLENLNFLQKTIATLNGENIHVICSNLIDLHTGLCPAWIDPYILLEINHKKVLLTAFCIIKNSIKKYGLQLLDIQQTLIKMQDVIKHIEPDVFIILNHNLYPESRRLTETADKLGINADMIIGGHEHSPIEHDDIRHIYYPQAYSKTMLYFKLEFTESSKNLQLCEEISCKKAPIQNVFVPPLDAYEEKSGLNIPVAESVLNLEKNYFDPSSLGTFIADRMKEEAQTDIGLISTGFISHALRYEANKILTHYNIERAFSSEAALQTVTVTSAELKSVFQNAVKMRYRNLTSNDRFLQCSQNISLICRKNADNYGCIQQIFINNEPLLDEKGEVIDEDRTITCAIDPFIGAGEQGFDVLRPLPKETLMRANHLVKIKDIFTQAIRNAAKKYRKGSEYPYFRIKDLSD